MIRTELLVFGVVGGLTVLVDFLCYRGLVIVQLADVDAAKGIGYLAGTVFAYFANRFWTFGHRLAAPGSVWRFVAVYAGTLAVNVAVNAAVLALAQEIRAAVQLAFLAATAVSASLNFAGMKWWVFNRAKAPEVP